MDDLEKQCKEKEEENRRSKEVEENGNDQQKASIEEIRSLMKELLAGEEKLRNEALERRKNLFFRKGKKWEGKERLETWIQRKAEEWRVNSKVTMRAAGAAKVVIFEDETARNKFWNKKEEIVNEGQYEIDEDLTLEERVRRNKLVEIGNKLRSKGNYCRMENRYIVVEDGKERRFYKWHPSTGLYEVGEPTEEKERKERARLEKKAKEEEERRKMQDW